MPGTTRQPENSRARRDRVFRDSLVDILLSSGLVGATELGIGAAAVPAGAAISGLAAGQYLGDSPAYRKDPEGWSHAINPLNTIGDMQRLGRGAMQNPITGPHYDRVNRAIANLSRYIGHRSSGY